MFGNKSNDDDDSIKIDTTQIRKNAGKRLDIQAPKQQSGIVSLNENGGIGTEFFTKAKKKPAADDDE